MAKSNNGNSQKQTISNITIARPEVSHVGQIESDVDKDIPETGHQQNNTFALIIANENYQDVAQVPNALHDGKVFAEYCEKTLGVSKENIKYVADATFNGI